MPKGCQHCKKMRLQLTVLFGALILINFTILKILNMEISSANQILFMPSIVVICIGAIQIFFKKNKPK